MPKMVTDSFGNRIFMQPMGRLSMHSKCLDFFLSGGGGAGGRGRIFSFTNMFPIRSLGSPCVPQGCSQYHLALIPYLLPQSPPLLTYIGGPKGEALHLSMESSILGSLASFNFFWGHGPIKLAHCQKKKKVGLVRHPN
jgi:hypothetical protein